MGVDWSAYRARLTADGMSDRERIIERTRQQILAQSAANPACREVLVDQIPQKLFINRSDELQKKFFNTLPGETMRLGSVVYWSGCHWLVIECVMDDEMTYHGMLQQCNRQLTWQNPETREIVSRWCTIEKPYYSNLSKDSQFAFSSREFKVQLPYDEESGLLDVDKRLMLEIINREPKVYNITSVDTNTERYDIDGESIGFLVLNLTQGQYNGDTDNAEYGVCDYLPPFDILRPTRTGYLVIEGHEDGIVPGGFPVTLTCRYFNYDDGTPREEEGTNFTFDGPSKVLKNLSYKQTGNNIKLTLAYSPDFIGSTIHVSAGNIDGTIGNEVDLKVVNSF